jgi:hypothetical protein
MLIMIRKRIIRREVTKKLYKHEVFHILGKRGTKRNLLFTGFIFLILMYHILFIFNSSAQETLLESL